MAAVFDCDNHLYEPPDCFTQFMPADRLSQALVNVRLSDGTERLLAGDRIATFNEVRSYDVAHRPGSLREMLAQMASGNPDETYYWEPMKEAYQRPDARLALMDEQGMTGCVLFPNGMALAAENFVRDDLALYANLESYNRWLHETWSYAHAGRIFATPLLSMRSLELALAEVDRVIERGARVVLLPTGPVAGRSPGDPYFDPFWARLEEAGVVVSYHIMENWYNAHVSAAYGHEPFPQAWKMSAWQWNNTYGERPIEDTLSALIFDNLFGRFPKLRVLAAEFGCEWLPHFVRHMDKSRGMGRNGPWIGGQLSERPSEVLRRHVRVVPYPEDDAVSVVERLGSADAIVMGSDFPHAEGMADPAQYVEHLRSLSAEDQRKIMFENAAELFDLAAMTPLAAAGSER